MSGISGVLAMIGVLSLVIGGLYLTYQLGTWLTWVNAAVAKVHKDNPGQLARYKMDWY